MRRAVQRLLAAVLLGALVVPVAVLGIFRIAPPPPTPFMMVRAVADGAGIDFRWVPRHAISPHLIRAVIAAEDARFMHHRGFDWTEIDAAWRQSRRGRRLRGASTISMQCARILFLWPGRGVVRKALEAYLTVLTEMLWPKVRIIETYVNLVEWGNGIYGCEAAADRYFGVSCAALGKQQAARLAATLPSPRRLSPDRLGPYLRRRESSILKRMPQVSVPSFWGAKVKTRQPAG